MNLTTNNIKLANLYYFSNNTRNASLSPTPNTPNGSLLTEAAVC